MNTGSDKISVERFERADYDQLMQLYRSVIGQDGCTWDIEYPSKEIILDDLSHKNIYGLRNNQGDIFGAVSNVTELELNHLDCWNQSVINPCELARLVIRKGYQSKGYAKEMLKQVIQMMKQYGYDGVHFLVSKTNEAAKKAYIGVGFHNCGETYLYGIDFYCFEYVI